MDCTICATKYRGEQRSPPEEVLEARGILREIGPETQPSIGRAGGFPVFRREAMTCRWFSALPMPIQRCTCDARVVVHGKASSTCTAPIPQVASVVGLAICSPAHRCRVGLQADAGSDPCVSMPIVASAEVGMCTPSQPPPWVATGPAIPCGKANGASLRPMGSSLKAGAAIGHVVSRSERDVTAHLEERQGAPGGLTEVEDEARAVAPSERQARPGGRGNVSAGVLDACP